MTAQRWYSPGSDRRGGRRVADVQCAVACAYCGDSTGRAFNVTERWFYWTCTRCARTELIVLATDQPDDAPASVELWRMLDAKGRHLECRIVLCPGRGFELRVTRGRGAVLSEAFVDPNALLNRSRDVRQRLLERGCDDVI